VKFLIPYPGGGSNDVLARIVGEKLQAKWGQPVIIENRTGGSGNIAAAAVAQAEPDGRVLAIHVAQAGERRLLASAAAAMSRRPAFAQSWRGNNSLGKIGHHD